MKPDPDTRRRHDENIQLGRDLARKLASEARMIAATLDHLADLHEDLARLTGHPRSKEARDRAATERTLAGRERQASEWFLTISDGSYRPDGRAVGDLQ